MAAGSKAKHHQFQIEKPFVFINLTYSSGPVFFQKDRLLTPKKRKSEKVCKNVDEPKNLRPAPYPKNQVQDLEAARPRHWSSRWAPESLGSCEAAKPRGVKPDLSSAEDIFLKQTKCKAFQSRLSKDLLRQSEINIRI